MTWTIRVLNWSDFQHYKDRDPPWIKLHQRRLFEKPAWRRASGAAAKLLVDVWMLAAALGKDGELDMTLTDLAYRVRLPEAAVLADLRALQVSEFLDLGDGLLADASGCKQMQADAVPEVETEGEKRQRQKSPSVAPRVENWTLPFGKAWEARFQGTTPWGRIGKALKPLRDQHPDAVIIQRWERFLAQARPGVSTPEGFAQTFGEWKPITVVASARITRDVAIRRALEVLHGLDDKRIPRDGFASELQFATWLANEVQREQDAA